MHSLDSNQTADLKALLEKCFSGNATLQGACDISDDSMKSMYEEACQLYSSGDTKESTRLFGVLVTFNPFEQKFWIGLAGSQHHERSYEKALQAYAVAALLDLRDPAPHYHAAQCYLAMRNTEEAIKALNIAETYASEHPSLGAFKLKIINVKEALLKTSKGISP